MKFSTPSGQTVVAALYTAVSFVIPAGRRQSLSLKFCLVAMHLGGFYLTLELLYSGLHCALVYKVNKYTIQAYLCAMLSIQFIARNVSIVLLK